MALDKACQAKIDLMYLKEEHSSEQKFLESPAWPITNADPWAIPRGTGLGWDSEVCIFCRLFLCVSRKITLETTLP